MVLKQDIQIEDNMSLSYEEINTRHQRFHDRIDQLSKVQMSHLCQESYLVIQVHNTNNTNTYQCVCDVKEMELFTDSHPGITQIQEQNLKSLEFSHKLRRCLQRAQVQFYRLCIQYVDNINKEDTPLVFPKKLKMFP